METSNLLVNGIVNGIQIELTGPVITNDEWITNLLKIKREEEWDETTETL